MKLLWCNSFPEIYAWLEEQGGGLICHWYMCIVLYMKLIWCTGFPEIYACLEGVGLICHRCMYIVLYIKLIWCTGFPEIYACFEEGVGSICHGYMCIVLYTYIRNFYGIMVFQRSMLNWKSGWGQSAIGTCALYYIYMKCIWCKSFPDIYAWLAEGGLICHGYMCIVLYMKLIWCNGFPETMLDWRRGWGQSAIGICALWYIWNWFGAMVFQRSMLV